MACNNDEYVLVKLGYETSDLPVPRVNTKYQVSNMSKKHLVITEHNSDVSEVRL